jgi:hypothetical protein
MITFIYNKAIPTKSYLLFFFALKLLGTERYARVSDHAFDPALGIFTGLNILPQCTAMSTYSYSLDDVHILRLQKAFLLAMLHGSASTMVKVRFDAAMTMIADTLYSMLAKKLRSFEYCVASKYTAPLYVGRA